MDGIGDGVVAVLEVGFKDGGGIVLLLFSSRPDSVGPLGRTIFASFAPSSVTVPIRGPPLVFTSSCSSTRKDVDRSLSSFLLSFSFRQIRANDFEASI